MQNFKPGVRVLFDVEDRDILTVHRRYVTRDLRSTEQEAKVQPSFVITFAEEGLAPCAVTDVLTACVAEADTAVEVSKRVHGPWE